MYPVGIWAPVPSVMAFWVVVQHGPGNPIEVEDNVEGELDMGPVEVLVEIKEENGAPPRYVE